MRRRLRKRWSRKMIRCAFRFRDLTDSSLHFYTADVNDTVIRFLVIHQTNGDYAVALDACQICGTAGYRQEGQNVVCRNCGATIYIPSIGDKRRLQSHSGEIARGRRRSDRGPFGAGKRRLDDSLLTKCLPVS